MWKEAASVPQGSLFRYPTMNLHFILDPGWTCWGFYGKKKKNRIRKRGGGRLAFCRAELCCISDLLTSPSLREMCVSAVLWRHKWMKIKETLAAQENPNCHVQLRTVIFRLKSGSGYTWGIVLKSTEIITKTLCFHWGGSRVLWL